jgi:phosphoenolpyruvate carboxykinase (ATP)
VFYLADTGYHDGKVVSSGPLNMAIFSSPGYFTDYAWLKIEDPALAAKVLADGRTIGHPAQAKTVIGQVRFVTRYCLPFTMGVSSTAHVVRFYEFLRKRKESGDPIEVYQFNPTGRIVAEYEWVTQKFGDKTIEVPKPKLVEVDGILRPIGGTCPTIEETELFILQAAREAVKYEPHPIWGEKVLVPVEIEGLSKERLKELYPTTHLPMDEIKRLLKVQILISKYHLDKQCSGLPNHIYNAMDF